MKRNLLNGVSASALVLMLSGPVLAADLYVEEPLVFESPRWAGLYIGGHLGYGKADNYWFDSTGQPRNDGNLLGGLQAGYNWQSGNVVWGLQVDGSATGMEGGDIDYIQAEVDFLASLRGILGYAFGDILVYGTGGVGVVYGAAASSTNPTNRENFARAVPVGGVGMQYAVDDRISVGIEGLYYGKTDSFGGGDDKGKIEGIWTGRTTLNVKLGGDGSVAGPMSPADGGSYARWEGLYAGGHLGYGKVEDFWFDSDGATGGPFNEGNFIGGLQAGYNWQTGDIVWGAVAEASATGMEVGEWDYAFAEIDYLASLRGKLGFAFDEKVVVYGTGGLGLVVGAGFSSTLPSQKDNFAELTYVAGAGVEVALDERLSIGAEGLYYGETGKFSASDDKGKIDGVWTGKILFNVKFGG
uniref:outer membrane protein n=1 Tax=Pararhizobium sp. IMCC3301 TaxID=3067904 RepID=UPI002740761A|nr:hypothetical protein [Pararhizobium sp. IMCC3301]